MRRVRRCWRGAGIHIIHQTGERDYNEARAAYASLGESAEVSKFIEDMPAAFARADLVVCRSGASTVAEITAAGKPAIFVPFPRAADDPQRVTAEALAGSGAAGGLAHPSAGRDIAGMAVRVAGIENIPRSAETTP